MNTPGQHHLTAGNCQITRGTSYPIVIDDVCPECSTEEPCDTSASPSPSCSS